MAASENCRQLPRRVESLMTWIETLLQERVDNRVKRGS